MQGLVSGGLCERERHTGAFMREVCLCVHAHVWLIFCSVHTCGLGGNGSRDCAVFKTNQFSSGLF